MIAPDTRLSLAEGISVQHLGEEEGAVVLSLESGQLFTCNDTTAEILRAAAAPLTFDAVIARLLTTFEVEEAELRADVATIINELAHEGILTLG